VDPPVILRPGGVTASMLREQIGDVIQPETVLIDDATIPRAPGMKYAHYAPNAPVYLIKPDFLTVKKAVKDIQSKGQTVALLAPEEFGEASANWFFSFGDSTNLDASAQVLYANLRACDDTTADIVLATVPDISGVGLAIFNRLEKAATGKWWLS
jgi:L-threonylcarbamoyladenylate synthase